MSENPYEPPLSETPVEEMRPTPIEWLKIALIAGTICIVGTLTAWCLMWCAAYAYTWWFWSGVYPGTLSTAPL